MTNPDRLAAKRRINLTIDENLIALAKELGLNASNAAEDGLRAAVRKAQEKQWLQENSAAIEANNERIRKYGTHLPLLWDDVGGTDDGAI